MLQFGRMSSRYILAKLPYVFFAVAARVHAIGRLREQRHQGLGVPGHARFHGHILRSLLPDAGRDCDANRDAHTHTRARARGRVKRTTRTLRARSWRNVKSDRVSLDEPSAEIRASNWPEHCLITAPSARLGIESSRGEPVCPQIEWETPPLRGTSRRLRNRPSFWQARRDATHFCENDELFFYIFVKLLILE